MAEEPVKPKGRGRNPQPAATSLFEWALEMEQERGEEPVARAARPQHTGGGRRYVSDGLPLRNHVCGFQPDRPSMYAALFCCPENRATGPPSAQLPDSSGPLCQPEPKVIPPSLTTQTRMSSVVTQLPSAVASNMSVPSRSLRSVPTSALL